MTRPRTVLDFTLALVRRIEAIVARYLATNGYTPGGGVGGTLTDGDKGDITVSGAGATWSIDAGAVGTPELAADAVTYAKMQNISAASRLLGRGSAGGAGDVEELTVSTGLSLTGTALSAGTLDTIPAPVAAVSFNGQQATSFVIENRTSDPGSPVAGQLWLRTDL